MQSHTVAVKPDISIHFVQDGNAAVSTLPGYDPGGTVEGTPQGTASTAADPQNGAKKRPRGRPRKGPKDNSAIDRRRAQIRSAQKAYRDRKDETIHTLEKRVQSLVETNEQLCSAFTKLRDLAVSNGLLVQNATPSDDVQPTPDACPPTANEQFIACRELPSGHHVTPPQQQAGNNNNSVMTSLNPPSSHQLPPNFPPQDPTVLPFSLDPSASWANLFPARAWHPLQESLLSAPGACSSYAHRETTFGRRLHRVALETGIALVNMPNMPREQFAKVFGFCMLFETVEDIEARLRASLRKTQEESLYHWQHPFLRLGGSGAHFPGFSATTTPPVTKAVAATVFGGGGGGGGGPGRRIGNHGTVESFKHVNASSGFGVGPFTRAAEEAREKHLDGRMHITVPGFQGDFFDSDEVELSLLRRGVYINPSQDFVRVEVDLSLFGDVPDQVVELGVSDMSSGNAMPSGPSFSGTCAAPLDPSHQFAGGMEASNMLSVDSSMIDMMLPATSLDIDEGFAEMFTIPNPLGAGNDGAVPGTAPRHAQGIKRVVILDVNLFVRELAGRVICLGRTPGWRPGDVNRAFRMAILES
ncbi:uncharacterized protein E0L32_002530 [Thyridium curvatum]|uniref:BZIP domain-containing protein n=1 Tax=Thyridium curvatum TaxID=1093900 RepID=A0A507BGQ0_9PEZI|nr:uncharacterized protein E0L32_002530 [Thyridium curvatum]TPX18673.1 hypothetical protein E0L32_002530 [Thyridium curvatum]